MANQVIHSLISSLNSNLTPVAYTLTAGTNISIVGHNVYTVGKVACVNICFTCSASIGTVDIMISGLPIPKNNVPVICVKNLGGAGFQAIIATTGTLRNDYDTFESGKKYFLNCCYAIA